MVSLQKLCFPPVIAAALLAHGCAQEQDGANVGAEEELVERSGELANQFQGALQKELATALGDGGPIGAVKVCQSAAPAIAQQLSQDSGGVVRRIARKNRNPGGGLPEELDALYRQLEAAPMDEGKPRAVHKMQDGRLTYMRAIPMKEQPCSACHGSAIDPELKAAIAEAYPDDRALGFQPEELRGAFLVQLEQAN